MNGPITRSNNHTIASAARTIRGPKCKLWDLRGQKVVVQSLWQVAVGRMDEGFTFVQCYIYEDAKIDGKLSPERAFWFMTAKFPIVRTLRKHVSELPAVFHLRTLPPQMGFSEQIAVFFGRFEHANTN